MVLPPGTITKGSAKAIRYTSFNWYVYRKPGADDMFKKAVYVVSTTDSAAGMRDAVKKMVPLALKLG